MFTSSEGGTRARGELGSGTLTSAGEDEGNMPVAAAQMAENNAAPDTDITDAISARDPHGLELLYDRYGGRAYSLALHLLGDAEAAVKLVESAFRTIWQSPQAAIGLKASIERRLLSAVSFHAKEALAESAHNAQGSRLQSKPVPAALPTRPAAGKRERNDGPTIAHYTLLSVRHR